MGELYYLYNRSYKDIFRLSPKQLQAVMDFKAKKESEKYRSMR